MDQSHSVWFIQKYFIQLSLIKWFRLSSNKEQLLCRIFVSNSWSHPAAESMADKALTRKIPPKIRKGQDKYKEGCQETYFHILHMTGLCCRNRSHEKRPGSALLPFTMWPNVYNYYKWTIYPQCSKWWQHHAFDLLFFNRNWGLCQGGGNTKQLQI